MIQDVAPLYFIELTIKLLHTLHLYPRLSINMIPSPNFSFGFSELITGPSMFFSAYSVRSEF